MTLGLLQSRKTKQKLYSRKTLHPTPHNIRSFNEYIKTYKRLCRQAKTSYYVNKLKGFKNDAKKTWDTVREVLGNFKDKSQVPEFFIENGKIISGDVNIAEGFNNFFSEIGTKLSDDIQDNGVSYQSYLKNPTEENFAFKQVTIESILEVGSSLKSKNSAGIDNLSSKQLKNCLPHLATQLSHLFNLSVQTSFPLT